MTAITGMRFVGLYRVSTSVQVSTGYSLAVQQDQVRTYIERVAGELVGEFVETARASWPSRLMLRRRPQLEAALALCKRRKATLVVARLDRLSRRVSFITHLIESKVRFLVAEFPAADELTLQIYAAMAEEESRRISMRVTATQAVLRQRGVKIPATSGMVIGRSAWQRQQSIARAEALAPVIAELRAEGYRTIREIAAALNARGIRNPFAGSWRPSATEGLLLRIKGNPRAAKHINGRRCGWPGTMRRAALAEAEKLRRSVNEIRRDGHSTIPAIMAELIARGVSSPTGRPWSPKNTFKLLRRLAGTHTCYWKPRLVPPIDRR